MKRRTVLVVDDEPAIVDIWTRILVDEGYRVLGAGDAFDALRLLATNQPTLAILDIHLPGPDGVWLADMIRQRCPQTAIVLATGDPTMPRLTTLRNAVVGHMVKPIGREEFLALVKMGIEWVSPPPAVAQ